MLILNVAARFRAVGWCAFPLDEKHLEHQRAQRQAHSIHTNVKVKHLYLEMASTFVHITINAHQ